MNDVLQAKAREQEGVVAVWQLRRDGMTRTAVEHHTRGLRELHNGVYLTGEAPLTRRQRWWAAVLTAPNRVLSHASAGAAWELRPWEGAFEVVTQEGSGGPQRFGALMVCRTKQLEATTLDDLPITTPERTLADLWPQLGDRARTKMLREALRLERTTPARLWRHLEAAPNRRRPASLAALLTSYDRLQLRRCRSDAEARAVELLAAAGIELPDVNVRRAGEEADLSWPAHRLIVEVDGDQFHRDKREDARKTATWTAAGWRVRRVESDVVFLEPERFIESTADLVFAFDPSRSVRSRLRPARARAWPPRATG